MGHLKKHFEKGFTTLPNELVRRNDISMTAKGLFWFFCSCPDDWNYSIEGTAALIKEGKDAIRSGVQELEKYGYLVRVQETSSSGRFTGYEYHLYTTPRESKPLAENTPLEKSRQLNNDLLNNRLTNKEKDISTLHSDISSEKKISKRFKKPTIEEIREYIKEQGYSIVPEAFYDYYESNGWHVGKNPMKDWKACVRTFQRNAEKYNYSNNTSKNNELSIHRKIVMK